MAVAKIDSMAYSELPPEAIAARKDFDKRYRHAGVTAEEFLRLRGIMSFEGVANKLCERIPNATSVEWVRRTYGELVPGERKPMARNGPRDDLTKEVIRELAENCRSVHEMMAKTGAGNMTIITRALRFGIQLPNGRTPKSEQQETVLPRKPPRRAKPTKGSGIVIAPRFF